MRNSQKHPDIRSARRSRGFIFLLGSRRLIRKAGTSAEVICPRCRQTALFEDKKVRVWFTFFLIPIFPIGSGQTICECGNCHTQFRLGAQELARQLSGSEQAQTQQAIQMYNSLRASPSNSVTLNQLMILYLQMHELDQAVSAAREFPKALEASEQCMVTLGRVLMEQGHRPEALQWFDAALARNPMQGDAAYWKAICLMGQEPPDLSGAMSAARIARTSGFEGADRLIAEIGSRQRA